MSTPNSGRYVLVRIPDGCFWSGAAFDSREYPAAKRYKMQQAATNAADVAGSLGHRGFVVRDYGMAGEKIMYVFGRPSPADDEYLGRPWSFNN